jgi:ABC-type nitrate/sulfonate/bicarbonate transport system substrate-binding protein
MSIPLGLAAMMQGDINYIGGVGPHTVSATLGGMPTRAVWIHASRLLSSIVSRPEFKRLNDLKGKKIGVIGLGGTTHTSMIMAIQKAGMDPKDFVFVNVPAGDHLKVLEARAIDAVSMDPPGLLYALRRGYSRILDIGSLVEMPIGGLTTLQETIERRPDEAKRAIRSVQQAKELMFKSKEQTVAVIMRTMKMDRETALESYEPLIKSLSRDGVPDPVGMENIVKAIKLQGRYIDKKVAFEDIADSTLARQVASELGSKSN